MEEGEKKEKAQYGRKEKRAVEAKEEAQRIAWGPFSFQASKALRNLGILEHLQKKGKQGGSIEEIASELGLPHYGTRVLLEAGLGIGLVHGDDDDRFTLSKTGYFIQNDPMTRVNMDFVEDVCYRGIQHLESSVQNQSPEGLKVFGDWSSIYQGLSELPEKARESWVAFDNYYSVQAFEDLRPYIFENEPKTIFDVGGNVGEFSLFVSSIHPDVDVTLLDLPGQLKIAEEKIREKGYEDRVSFYPIDFLQEDSPFPKGADMIWMSQFLDCFSEDEIRSILLRAKEALNENGRILIMETFWDRQRFEAGSFSLQQISLYFTTMANGNSQMYHSKRVIEQIHNAGLYVDRDIDGLGIGHTLLSCRIKP